MAKKIHVSITERDVYIAAGSFMAGTVYMAAMCASVFKKQQKQLENQHELWKRNHEAVMRFVAVTPDEVWLPIAKQLLTDYEFQAIVREEEK